VISCTYLKYIIRVLHVPLEELNVLDVIVLKYCFLLFIELGGFVEETVFQFLKRRVELTLTVAHPVHRYLVQRNVLNTLKKHLQYIIHFARALPEKIVFYFYFVILLTDREFLSRNETIIEFLRDIIKTGYKMFILLRREVLKLHHHELISALLD
jgi:hypothetical protein